MVSKPVSPAKQAALLEPHRHDLLPEGPPQVLPIQQLPHDVTRDALGCVSDVKCVVLGHAVSSSLSAQQHHWDNLLNGQADEVAYVNCRQLQINRHCRGLYDTPAALTNPSQGQARPSDRQGVTSHSHPLASPASGW